MRDLPSIRIGALPFRPDLGWARVTHGALLPERDAGRRRVSKVLNVGRARPGQVFLKSGQSSHGRVAFACAAGVRRKRGRKSDGVDRSHRLPSAAASNPCVQRFRIRGFHADLSMFGSGIAVASEIIRAWGDPTGTIRSVAQCSRSMDSRRVPVMAVLASLSSVEDPLLRGPP